MILPCGGRLSVCSPSLVISFPGPRKVLSTSWLGGGYREDLTSIFNHQISREACTDCHAGGSVKGYLEGAARSIALDPARTTGLLTRAAMENAAQADERFCDLAVCAVVTAGIDRNGGRAGDPASYCENGDSFEPVGGTINTILLVGADLPEHTMARALMTAAEAKAAALQQLMARSLYSHGIATGSGTDMIAIAADPSSPLRLTDAGKHAKLGELIGRAVIRATALALERETGLSPASQRDALVRLLRFGIAEEDLLTIAEGMPGTITDRETFRVRLRDWSCDPYAVARVAAALHVAEEAGWGLLPVREAERAVDTIFGSPGDPVPGGDPVRRICRAVVREAGDRQGSVREEREAWR